jgi:hypothetical protein
MTPQKNEVNQFAAHAERIVAYHEGFQKAFGDQMSYAVLAGFELNRIKEALPHGQFMKWREKFLPQIPHRTATQYMEFQTKLATHRQFPSVGNVKLLGNGELPDKDKAKVVEAVHQIADGKTLTQLYRDLGVIREKKPAQHHPRKPVSPEDKLSANKEHARGVMSAMLAPIATFMLDPGATLVELTKAERQQLLDAFVSASNEVRKFQKGK